MTSNHKKLIAVVGASGQQGGAVVKALQSQDLFRVRALTRHPDKHTHLAEQVQEADLDRPDTLSEAFKDAYGVFLVTDFWQAGPNEIAQASAAIRAAKNAGVEHFIWSTLPDVERISDGRYLVPHFTMKAKVNQIIEEARFRYYTFVIPPFFYQNLTGVLAPKKQDDGTTGWALPIDPAARVIHAGDITELGKIVAGAFAKPEESGKGAYLPLVGDLLSFGDIVDILNQQGNSFSFTQIPTPVFAGLFEGAAGIADTFSYFNDYTYLGADSLDQIELAGKIAGGPMTGFAAWARKNFRYPANQTLIEK